MSQQAIHLSQNQNSIYIFWALRADIRKRKTRDSDYDVEFGLSYFYQSKVSLTVHI